MKAKLPRRQRIEALIHKYPDSLVRTAITIALAKYKLAIFSDEYLEDLFLDLREIEQMRCKRNAENHARLAS